MSRHSSYNSHASRLTYNSHDLLTTNKQNFGGHPTSSPLTKEQQLRQRSKALFEEETEGKQHSFTQVSNTTSTFPFTTQMNMKMTLKGEGSPPKTQTRKGTKELQRNFTPTNNFRQQREDPNYLQQFRIPPSNVDMRG